MKGAGVAVYGMSCIDLNNNMLKILGTHFSYNKKLKEEKKNLQDHKRYLISIENMENEKPYIRRKNRFF